MNTHQQFRTKAEAQQAIQDMDRRADTAIELAVLHDAGSTKAREHIDNSTTYRAESARIRALLPTLPE